MTSVKGTVNKIVDQALLNKILVASGHEPEPMTNHMLITGNPGTGKTLAARKMGELFHELGLVSNPKTTELTRADLVGEFVNQAAENAKRVIDAHRGQLIFIDEAYTLYNGPGDQEGRQVLDELMRLSEEYRGDTVIVLAGYEESMRQLFEANPGLKSRFPRTVDLPDLKAEEKGAVLDYMVGQNKRTYASATARSRARAYAARMPSGGEQGNARAVRNFYDALRDAQASRLVAAYASAGAVDPKALHSFTSADVTNAAAELGLPPLVTRVRRKPSARAGAARKGYVRRKAELDVVA
jgi:replication-associated recombination protein RarA